MLLHLVHDVSGGACSFWCTWNHKSVCGKLFGRIPRSSTQASAHYNNRRESAIRFLESAFNPSGGIQGTQIVKGFTELFWRFRWRRTQFPVHYAYLFESPSKEHPSLINQSVANLFDLLQFRHLLLKPWLYSIRLIVLSSLKNPMVFVSQNVFNSLLKSSVLDALDTLISSC